MPAYQLGAAWWLMLTGISMSSQWDPGFMYRNAPMPSGGRRES